MGMKGYGLLTAMLFRQIEQSCEYDWAAPFAEVWAVMFLSLLCVFMLQGRVSYLPKKRHGRFKEPAACDMTAKR